MLHPYVPVFTTADRLEAEDSVRPWRAVSVARIDFDKNTDWLLHANRALPPAFQIRIFGSENRMFSKTRLLPVFPEFLQDSHRSPEARMQFGKTWGSAQRLCRMADFLVDMSAIEGDGGGTQYTFLEAIDAGTVCVLNSAWFRCPSKELASGVNCLAVDSPAALVVAIQKTYAAADMARWRSAAAQILQQHAPEVTCAQLVRVWKRG